MQHHVNIIKFRCARSKRPAKIFLPHCPHPQCALLFQTRKALIILGLGGVYTICTEIPAWSIRAWQADIMRPCMKFKQFRFSGAA